MEIADIRSLLLKQAVARSSNNSSDWDFSQVEKLKKETVNEWSNSKFNKVYERMASQLQ